MTICTLQVERSKNIKHWVPGKPPGETQKPSPNNRWIRILQCNWFCAVSSRSGAHLKVYTRRTSKKQEEWNSLTSIMHITLGKNIVISTAAASVMSLETPWSRLIQKPRRWRWEDRDQQCSVTGVVGMEFHLESSWEKYPSVTSALPTRFGVRKGCILLSPYLCQNLILQGQKTREWSSRWCSPPSR